jgi:hypothetical protein
VESVRFLASLTARIGFAAGISYLAYRLGGSHKYGLVILVLTAPLWGVLLRKPILEGISAYFKWVKKQPYVPWQGRYYEFENVHVRVFEDDFGHLWFCDKDVLQVLGQSVSEIYQVAYPESDYRKIPGERLKGFSENAVILVVSRIRHPSAGKFNFWLEREVLAPHHKKREKAGLPSSARHQEKDPFRPMGGNKA